ncbi:MAG: PKD domain-containing protein, partial [Holophagales bacterium]|nr:PKD domain-containing protein [Holophagales bacterium]
GTPHDDDPDPTPSGPPKAAFTVDADCSDDLCRARTAAPVRFTDTSTGRITSRTWDFGEGTRVRQSTVDYAWAEPGFYDVTLTVTDGSQVSTASKTFLVEAAEPRGTCVADAETLCLHDSRYAVTADWRVADGDAGTGRVVRAGTNDSGMFWFFTPSNWEVLIKVLDGCALNGHVWVFGASTTDLGYSIRLTDTLTGTVREYGNEPGMPAPAITDVAAFAEGCR